MKGNSIQTSKSKDKKNRDKKQSHASGSSIKNLGKTILIIPLDPDATALNIILQSFVHVRALLLCTNLHIYFRDFCTAVNPNTKLYHFFTGI